MESLRDLNNAITVVWTTPSRVGSNHSEFEAVYKGLAWFDSEGIVHLCRDFPQIAGLRLRPSNFTYVNSFRDPNFPHNYAPFEFRLLARNIYVTYALKTPIGNDDVKGDALATWMWVGREGKEGMKREGEGWEAGGGRNGVR